MYVPSVKVNEAQSIVWILHEEPIWKVPVAALCPTHVREFNHRENIGRLTCNVLNICVNGSILIRKWQTIIDELK